MRTVAVRVFVIRRNDTVQYADEHAAADLGLRRSVHLSEAALPATVEPLSAVCRFRRSDFRLAADTARSVAAISVAAAGGMLGRTVLLARRACRRTERDDDSAGHVSEPAADRLFVVPLLPFTAMTLPKRIPTEIVQLFSSAEAWSYRLIPYARKDGTVLCAGEQGHDYASASQEIEVLSGFRVQIESVGPDELSLLLNRYYRREGTRPISGRTADLSRIGSGQGFLTDLIGEAFDEYASDIHFEPYEERCRIRLRIDGKLIEKYVLDRSGYASIVNQIKIMANLDISERRLPQDGRILYHRGDRKFDLRVSSLPTIYGEKVVLRLLTRHAELLELSNLGFSERQLADYESAIARPHGMALITGPTGSGKSTTLYATLRRLNRESGNILTIEDPVEYTLEGVNQVQLKEEIGLTFGAALRTFLRQDPDIIMLGEIRDADTAAMAIRSSLTGHLVFSTIHTNSAWGSVSRLRDMGVHPYLLSGTLILCAAQRLVRLLCPDCKKEAVLTEPEYEQIYGQPRYSDRKGTGGRISEAAALGDDADANRTEPFPPADPCDGAGRIPASGRTGPQPAGKAARNDSGHPSPPTGSASCGTGDAPARTHFRPVGCERCYYTGYRGRRAIYEVIPIDDELAEAVRESRPDIAPLLEKRGITTLKDSALDLFLSGQTSLEEVLPLLRE